METDKKEVSILKSKIEEIIYFTGLVGIIIAEVLLTVAYMVETFKLAYTSEVFDIETISLFTNYVGIAHLVLLGYLLLDLVGNSAKRSYHILGILGIVAGAIPVVRVLYHSYIVLAGIRVSRRVLIDIKGEDVDSEGNFIGYGDDKSPKERKPSLRERLGSKLGEKVYGKDDK